MGLFRPSFERAYQRGETPWDTGITPPELLSLLETLEPGSALDVGCGTGTNAIELGNRGWFVTGVDASPTAIANARRKAEWVSGVTFVEGDVTRLGELGVDGPFDLVVDIGCFHGVPASRRADYVREVARVARPGAALLLFAFGPRLRWPWSHPTREREIRGRFAEAFELVRVEPGTEPKGAAWFTLRRRGSP